MLKRTLLIPISLACLPALAQDGRMARYAFVPAREGTLRLDTTSGAVSLCEDRAGVVTCRPFPAGDADLRAELHDVAKRVAALEDGAGGSGPDGATPRGLLARVVSLGDEAGGRLLVTVRKVKAWWE